MTKYKKIASIVCYSFVGVVTILLIFVPLITGWPKEDIKSILCWGGASSLVAAFILGTFTSWILPDNIVERILAPVKEKLEDLAEIRDSGIQRIFINRVNSISYQNELIKEGNDIFILATTLNTLLADKSKIYETIIDRLEHAHWKMRILLVYPECYDREIDILEASGNMRKMISKLKFLNDEIRNRAIDISNKIEIRFLKRPPYLFIVGNEDYVLVSNYDYMEAGSQPVFLYDNKKNSFYRNYKRQFENEYRKSFIISSELDNLINYLENKLVKLIKN